MAEVQSDVEVEEHGEAGAAHNEVVVEEVLDDAIVGHMGDDVRVAEVEVGGIEHELQVEDVVGVGVGCVSGSALAEPGVVGVAARAAVHMCEADNAHDFSALHWHWHWQAEQ